MSSKERLSNRKGKKKSGDQRNRTMTAREWRVERGEKGKFQSVRGGSANSESRLLGEPRMTIEPLLFYYYYGLIDPLWEIVQLD